MTPEQEKVIKAEVQRIAAEKDKEFEAKYLETLQTLKKAYDAEHIARIQAEQAYEKLKHDSVQGIGGISDGKPHGSGRGYPSKEDLAPYAQAKIESMPLQEIVSEIARAKGKTYTEYMSEEAERVRAKR